MLNKKNFFLLSYINKLVKHNNALSKSNRMLYNNIEKLSETSLRNKMEKAYDKSFVNILYCQIKINTNNIKALFDIDKMNDAKINKMEEDIKTLFTKLKNNENYKH
jgi:hypothetical protein